mmetsp:Transcript_6351/g.9227  ORF Transcript_6351/g.9227 Transcript_6351/m.9227 type:complete len:449 (+) Transcript_6351:57-1403(+)
MSSSEDFFSQPFGAVDSTTARNRNNERQEQESGMRTSNRAPPPPPPPFSSSASTTTTATATARGYQGRGNNMNPRPTGDYYPTGAATTSTSGNASISSSSQQTAFYSTTSYNGGGYNQINTATDDSASMSTYGGSQNTIYQQDSNSWYTTGTTSNTGTTAGLTSNTVNNAVAADDADDDDGMSFISGPMSTGNGMGMTNNRSDDSLGEGGNRQPSNNNINMGRIDSMGGSMNAPSSGNSYNPQFHQSQSQTSMHSGGNSQYYTPRYDPTEFENEPPLLEELGVNFSHIRTKSLSVILPVRYAKAHIDASIMEDNDMAGPLAFALLLGAELLLSGKVQFGYIYGFGLFGCIAMTLVLNLMAPTAISLWTVMSILGYALLPVNFLAALNIVFRITRLGQFGSILAALIILWCTVSSTRLFERGCELRDQRYLIAYPNALLYSAFVILTIF